MTTDPTAADARARIAAALSPMTVVGGTPPQLLVPVLDASNPRMARIADWQPLDALVEALLAAVSVPPPPPARSATRGLSVPHRDALWDAVAPPGPARPTFPEQHERVCRAVAEILDEVAPPVPAADRAAVLSEAAQRLYTALFPAVYADMGQKAAEGVNRAVSELRRLADEEQPGFGPAVDCQTGPKADSKADEEQPAEVCGKTFGVSGDEYPPCARRPGHREAYCRSADGSAYFLAALREEQPATEAPVENDALIEEYLRFLRGLGPEPDLSDLPPTRREAITGQFEIVKALADRDPELPALERDPVARRLGLHAPAVSQQPAAAYSDGKGRVYCLACASKVAAEVPLTVEDVDHWELCPSCGRHVIDVARAEQQPAAADTDEEQRDA